jgi:hypothetical protein
MFSELRWEVIVCFVDIGGIDDHYCLNFLACVQWVKMRGDCLLCWHNKQSPLILTHWTQKRKFKQEWSSIPSISTKQTITFHLNSLNTKKKASELRWEVIVCFVDIGGFDDHYCLSFLVCVLWDKMRGYCLIYWYWWNWTRKLKQ